MFLLILCVIQVYGMYHTHQSLSPGDDHGGGGGGGKVNLAALDMELDGPYSTPTSPAHKVRNTLVTLWLWNFPCYSQISRYYVQSNLSNDHPNQIVTRLSSHCTFKSDMWPRTRVRLK